MTDKKKKQEKRELNEVNLTTAFKDKVFPTRLKGENTTLAIVINDRDIAYLCMDITPGAVILHLYLPPVHRSTKTIFTLVEVFYDLVHPWVRNQGCDMIIVNCPADDVKTTELFRTFGFKPETINLAAMPVN